LAYQFALFRDWAIQLVIKILKKKDPDLHANQLEMTGWNSKKSDASLLNIIDMNKLFT
jgi:hypothetical protein